MDAFSGIFVRDVSAGSSHSAAITSDGELYTWGLGEYGRLGHGDAYTNNKPKLVRALFMHANQLYQFSHKNDAYYLYSSVVIPGLFYWTVRPENVCDL